MNQPSYLMISTNPGSVSLLKEEMKRNYPHLHPSFTSGQLVTFKSSAGPIPANFKLNAIFARTFAFLLFKSDEQNLQKNIAQWLESKQMKKVFFDCWPAKDGLGQFLPLISEWPAEVTLSVVKTGENEYWVGERPTYLTNGPYTWQSHQEYEQLALPEESPSRSYLKMAQGFYWAKLKLSTGDRVLEIGSAPGGMTYFFLQGHCRITGVDTGEMAPVCLKNPLFRQIPLSLHKVKTENLPREIDWLVIDVNLDPKLIFPEWRELLTHYRSRLKGCLVNLKLVEGAKQKIPQYLKEVGKMGWNEWKAVQLPAHGQEFLIIGLSETCSRVDTGL
ncbi:MAG: SAM-dependent methyltransferase [Pseudomonadota bacterium]